jgi:hypothetical protein
VMPDDRIVLANVDAGSRQTLAMRFLPDGQLDSTFGIEGNVPFPQGLYLVPNGVQFRADGSLVLGGTSFTPQAQIQCIAGARLTYTGQLASDGLLMPFTGLPASIPAIPGAGATTKGSAAPLRGVWSAITGDGIKTQFTVRHNLGVPTVRVRGFRVSGGQMSGERILSYAANPLDQNASVLVQFAAPLPSGTSLLLMIEA